jgi:hypothetical protein
MPTLPPAPSGGGRGASFGFPITPDDNALLPFLAKWVYVGVTGILTIQLMGGAIVTLIGVPAGTLLEMNVMKVLATGTTAGGLVGLY